MEVEGWLTRAARTSPAHVALQTPAGAWSYAHLLAAAQRAAAELRAHGISRGARVAIALPAGLAFAQALHACMLLGAIAVPVDLRLAPGERERIAGGADLLVDAPIGERIAAAASAPGEASPVRHELDATALVIHTSGTTSGARPVALTYGNLLWSALGSAVALGSSRRERWLCTLPLSHVGGLSIVVRSCIYATTAVVHERFETDRVLHALAEERTTLVSLVATTLARLLDAGLRDAPALRGALTGGGPVAPALVRRARDVGIPVSLTYGLTEACSQVTTAPLGAPAQAPAAGGEVPQSAGPPLFCTRVRIAADREILVAGPTVAPGSLGPDGWLATGDLGSLDGEGRLGVIGRKADTIVSGGENISPAEIEAVLEAHPDVLEAGVVGTPDPGWGEIVTAFVVARPGATPSPEALRAHCAGALASYKLPKQVNLVSQPLPRTPSGKLLRRELGASKTQSEVG